MFVLIDSNVSSLVGHLVTVSGISRIFFVSEKVVFSKGTWRGNRAVREGWKGKGGKSPRVGVKSSASFATFVKHE
jgi:hypothetical protein